eukprot:evm.model.NODE_17102_length_7555_cov_17.337128.1
MAVAAVGVGPGPTGFGTRAPVVVFGVGAGAVAPDEPEDKDEEEAAAEEDRGAANAEAAGLLLDTGWSQWDSSTTPSLLRPTTGSTVGAGNVGSTGGGGPSVITAAALRPPGVQAGPLLELGLGPGPSCEGTTDMDLLLLLLLIAGPGPPTITTAPPRPLLRPATPPPRWPGGALRPRPPLPFMIPEEGTLRLPIL